MITEALGTILAAQSCLQQATFDFLNACTTLKSAVYRAKLVTDTDHNRIEAVLSEVKSQIDSIAVVETQLQSSRVTLEELLDAAAAHVPIHRLPPEILSRIFHITVASSPCCHMQDQREVLLDLVLVCARWRQIAIDGCSLWSHIDLHAGLFSRTTHPPALLRTKLWLERSRGTSPHVHLCADASEVEPETVASLVSMLQLHDMPASSLTLFTTRGTSLSQALLNLYIGDGTLCSLETLAVARVWVFDQLSTIPRSGNPLRGLMHLKLEHIVFTSLEFDRFSRMLSDCPRLCTLRLRELSLEKSSQQNIPMIALPNLELLELAHMRGDGLEQLYAALYPGLLKLDLRWELASFTEEKFASLKPLLGRSNTASLAIREDSFRPKNPLSEPYLLSVPHLRALHLNCGTFEPSYTLSELAASPISYFPHFEYLSIFNGEITMGVMDQIKHIVSNRNLRSLVFLDCRFPPSFDNCNATARAALITMPENTRRWLCERIGRVVVRETPPRRVPHYIDFLEAEWMEVDRPSVI
ncbi:hypothetical protein FRC12_010755 [Ceratobasidium sp. 428]|nr:hypothetical protein FRC12_010755 [Ceratobasidium sp. 428]